MAESGDRDRRRFTRAARLLTALALLPALPGCIAAAALAVPAMTATGVVTQKKNKPPGGPPAQPAQAAPSARSPELANSRPAPAASPLRAEQAELTDLAELPPPTAPGLGPGAFSGPFAPAQWQEFFRFAASAAAAREAGSPASSVLLPPYDAMSLIPRRILCTAEENGVIIDLDPPGGQFDPHALAQPVTGIADGLSELRARGVVVLWISQLPADRIADVGIALQATGLDPAGRDPILLALKQDDRKQVMRDQANEAVCVLAMAGDERSDFDELFAYLRDPGDATRFDGLIGSGWFLVPRPLPGR